ncbi:hypothetical protein AAHA92_09895 [Salvia divinorum]|uniref:Uncharacterized protein n=1 Tax=Salvia divinorum TaxID=28513 RepID=A0ABD1HUA8_SALDI
MLPLPHKFYTATPVSLTFSLELTNQFCGRTRSRRHNRCRPAPTSGVAQGLTSVAESPSRIGSPIVRLKIMVRDGSAIWNGRLRRKHVAGANEEES